MGQGILASVETLLAKENKRKLAEDTRLAALVGKHSKEILDDVVMETLKTLFVEIGRAHV